MPFWYSNTVMFANPTVSRSKRNGGVPASAARQEAPAIRATIIADPILFLINFCGERAAQSAGGAIALWRFGKIAEATEFLVAFFQQLIDRRLEQALKVRSQRFAQNFCGFLMVAVSAAIWLHHNFIDDVEFHQILRGQFECLGRFGGVASIFPQNGGAGFGADDRIVGVLQDHDMIGHTDAKGPAGAALDDGGEN